MKNNLRVFVNGLLLRHICQLVCNAHAITDILTSESVKSDVIECNQERISTAIYPTASLMNHSCDPSIISSFYKDVLVVKAVKNIKQGEEIFNCYGPHFKRMPQKYREECLKEQYFFYCECYPCSTERN